MNHLKRLSSIIREIITTYSDVFLFLMIVEIKVLCYGKQISQQYFSARMLRFPVLASVLPIIGISLLFRNRTRLRFLLTANGIISLILFADIIYYRYFKDIISIAAVRDSLLLGDVSSSVKSLIHIKDFLFFIDIILLIPLLRYYKNLHRKQLNFFGRLARVCIILLFAAILDGKYIYQLSKDQPLLINTMSNKIYLTKILGNLNFHMLDTYNFVSNNISKNRKVSEERKEEIKHFLQDHYQSQDTAFRGTAAGKNLIMIQVEALQQFAINAKINGQDITPNLNRWIKKSLYFDNYFYQVAAGNTSDAEFITNNSLYPAAAGAAYYKYTGNSLESLPNVLKKEGYYTAALHGYTEGFWNRNVMYKTEGFDNFFGEHSFNLDETVGLGLSDRSFLNQTLEKLKTFKKPYYAFVITLSSHFPYDGGEGYGKFDVGNYEGTFLGDYLKAIHYTDIQLGHFLDQLEQEGVMKDSLIMLYGDHFAVPKRYADQLYAFKRIENPTDFEWFQLQKVPMMIHFPGDEHKGLNHNTAGQIDMYPTLANLLSLPNNTLFGNDLLNTKQSFEVFRDGSFTNGKIVYISSANTYYDLTSKEMINETSELAALKEQALKELSYSDDILDFNLLPEIK